MATTGTFKPAPTSTAPASTTTSPPASTASKLAADGLSWPPFGPNVHIHMQAYKPADKALRPAVIAAEDYLLAVWYSDYKGGRDKRWENYVSGHVRSEMASYLAAPDVTTESFVGTLRVWDMSAARFPKNEVEVADCIDSAGAKDTDLATGAILPRSEQNNTDENYYFNADIVAKVQGHWRVISFNQIDYPRAVECKP